MARLLMSPWADGRVPFAGCRVLGACEDKGAFLLNLLSAFPQQCVWGVGVAAAAGGATTLRELASLVQSNVPTVCACVYLCVWCVPQSMRVCVFV